MNSNSNAYAALEGMISDFAVTNNLGNVPLPPVASGQFTVSDRSKVGSIFCAVVDQLNQYNLYKSNIFNNALSEEACNSVAVGNEDLGQTNLVNMFNELCEVAKVPSAHRVETMRQLASTLAQYNHGAVSTNHWAEAKNTEGRTNLGTIYPMGVMNSVTFQGARPGRESFGAAIDTVLPDIRVAMTLVLMKPHAGLMSRFMHRRATNSAVVQYVINYDEFYRLDKSQDKESTVRYDHGHRIPIVNLWTDPSPTDMTLTRFEPLVSNDPTGEFLVADGILKFGPQAHMFDLCAKPDSPAFRNINWTDLVSDQVLLDAIVVEISDGTVTEQFQIDVAQHSTARLLMSQNNFESGNRETRFNGRVEMNKHSETSAGVPTELFKDCDPANNEQVLLELVASPAVDLKTGIAACIADRRLHVLPRDHKKPMSDALVTTIKSYTVTLIGYKLDMKYSEENLRKVNQAVRSLTHTQAYELPQGKAIVVDFSMQQSIPDHIMTTAQQTQSIGIDYRNLQAFLKTIRYVHDRNILEKNTKDLRSNMQGITLNRNYICGPRINPTVLMKKLELNRIVTVRSSDLMGDARQFCHSFLVKMISQEHWQTLYLQQLNAGETACYKCITTAPILENLFGIPHIHPSMMPEGHVESTLHKPQDRGAKIEFRLTLTNGVVVEFITTSFKFMEDTMILVPYRESDPTSELNFGHNWDGGEFASSYNMVDMNEVNRRMYLNTREFPIITNPSAMLIQVVGLQTLIPTIQVEADANFLMNL